MNKNRKHVIEKWIKDEIGGEERSQHGGEMSAQTTSALNLPGTTGVSHT